MTTPWPSGLYKIEMFRKCGLWRNLEAVKLATLEWVGWFNNRLLLQAIGNIPLVGLEMAYYRGQQSQAMVA